MNKLGIIRRVGLTSVLAFATCSHAAVLPLTPGSFGSLNTTGTLPGATGNVIASWDSGAVQDQPDLRFTAEVHSVVVSGDTANTLGGLSFYYKLDNVVDAATEGRFLQGLGIPFNQSVAAVGVDQDVSGNAADIAALAIDGKSVNFTFVLDSLVAGDSSAWLVIHTALTAYTWGFVGVVDGTTEDVPALIPVPEPATMAAVCALGLLGFAAYRRIRSQASF